MHLRTQSPLAAGVADNVIFRPCLRNHPSVRSADSFPQGKPNRVVGSSKSKNGILLMLSERSRPFPTVHFIMCGNIYGAPPPVGAHNVRPLR